MIKKFKEYKVVAVNKAIEKNKEITFDKVDDRYYYVYRITDLVNNVHYYGARVSKVHPKDDLGIKYFSSSKTLRPLAKENPNNFKFKIVKIFDNNNDKILYESYLHQYFDVKLNDKFYNKVNQTPFGFDSTGKISVKDKDGNTFSVLVTDERYLSGELVIITKDRINVKDKEGNLLNVSIDDERYLSGELVNYHTGMKRNEESKKLMSTVQKELGKDNITAKDKNGKTYYIKRTDPRYLSGELVHYNTGRTAYNKGVPCSKERKAKQSAIMKGRVASNKGMKIYYTLDCVKVMDFECNKETRNLYTLKELREKGIEIITASKNRNKGKKGFYNKDGKRVLRYYKEDGLYTSEEAKELNII